MIARPKGYVVGAYGEMIRSTARMDRYEAALRQVVRPGAVVLDIGAGTGIFSLLACQMGAGEVHAIEPDPSIEVAKEAARLNGFADRITFHDTLSTRVTLPRKADVIVSDLRGVMPLFQHHVPSIRDARTRLLAPGGALIPRRDRLWAALIEHPETYRDYEEPWRRNKYGLDFSPGQPIVVNTWRKVNAEAADLLSEPVHWATLDYATIEEPDASADLAFLPTRQGTAHGFLIWFDTELADGIGFSSAPGEPRQIYGQAFFPFAAPVRLGPEMRVEIRLLAKLIDGDYTWVWNTRVIDGSSPGPVASFRQSTALGVPLSLDALRRRAATHVPVPGREAEVAIACLGMADGVRPLRDIAETLAARFPDRFARLQEALSYAADLLDKYGTAPERD